MSEFKQNDPVRIVKCSNPLFNGKEGVIYAVGNDRSPGDYWVHLDSWPSGQVSNDAGRWCDEKELEAVSPAVDQPVEFESNDRVQYVAKDGTVGAPGMVIATDVGEGHLVLVDYGNGHRCAEDPKRLRHVGAVVDQPDEAPDDGLMDTVETTAAAYKKPAPTYADGFFRDYIKRYTGEQQVQGVPAWEVYRDGEKLAEFKYRAAADNYAENLGFTVVPSDARPVEDQGDWCNCQAVEGSANYPGPWHEKGGEPHYPCAQVQGVPLKESPDAVWKVFEKKSGKFWGFSHEDNTEHNEYYSYVPGQFVSLPDWDAMRQVQCVPAWARYRFDSFVSAHMNETSAKAHVTDSADSVVPGRFVPSGPVADAPQDEDTLNCDIHTLSGHLDACLDGLGHTGVHSLGWLRDFQSGSATSDAPAVETRDVFAALDGEGALRSMSFHEENAEEAAALYGGFYVPAKLTYTLPAPEPELSAEVEGVISEQLREAFGGHYPFVAADIEAALRARFDLTPKEQ